VHAFDVLGDPVRRRLLELLSGGERSAGSLGAVVGAEFGITQPAVSQHLRVLRETGFVRVRPVGTVRLYAADPGRMREADDWLGRLRDDLAPRLDTAAGRRSSSGRNVAT
jgi:DNA-binding transcriptional ArsR family regulator